jgi:hypothetical protein
VGEEEAVQPRAVAVIGIGLLLALAATVGPQPPAAGAAGASLAVRLPDAVRTIVMMLLALSALLLLAIQRPRRPAEDEPGLDRVRARGPSWTTAIFSLLPLLLVVAVVCYIVWNPRSDGEAHPIETAFTAIAGLLDLLARSRKAPTSVPLFDLTIAVLLLALAVAVFGLMVVVVLAERLEKWWAGRGRAEVGSPAPDRGDDGHDDLRAEPDARVAVIRAYGRFEHVAAAARAPRVAWQTPAEFMRTTVARLSVPAPPVERLTTLFEIARFSNRPVGATARDAACDCLDEITTALETEPPPSLTAHPRREAGTRSDTTEPPPSLTAHPRREAGTRSDTTEPPPSLTAHPRRDTGKPHTNAG